MVKISMMDQEAHEVYIKAVISKVISLARWPYWTASTALQLCTEGALESLVLEREAFFEYPPSAARASSCHAPYSVQALAADR